MDSRDFHRLERRADFGEPEDGTGRIAFHGQVDVERRIAGHPNLEFVLAGRDVGNPRLAAPIRPGRYVEIGQIAIGATMQKRALSSAFHISWIAVRDYGSVN